MRAPVVDNEDRVLVAGRPDLERCDNKISTAKYSLLTFLPIATFEQFRRVANMYFLVMGLIMAIGWYTPLFESAILPWTTLGPLAIVVSFSLTQEGIADYRRHQSDDITNNRECIVLRRAEELDAEGGSRESTVRNGEDVEVNLDKDRYAATGSKLPPTPVAIGNTTCKIAFQTVKRMRIRQGQIVMVRNRDMIPADLILLASSAENGNVYIETMSIDGETNLKLRTSPRLPEDVAKKIHQTSPTDSFTFGEKKVLHETLEQATARISRLSALGFPNGISALDNPANPKEAENDEWDGTTKPTSGRARDLLGKVVKGIASQVPSLTPDILTPTSESKFITALKTEPPNASVNTFNGVLWLPPIEDGGSSVEIPLNGENMLLRGAVLRNTEWAIGLSCYTGGDTKLVQNSVETPSKFSRLDQLANSVVYCVIGVMLLCIATLASLATHSYSTHSSKIWYLGMNTDANEKWPNLPNLPAPQWRTTTPNWAQVFFLFLTLLNSFLPISLYVTLEFITITARIFINQDVNMYDPHTDTRTVARSTTVSDLGQVEYIFSDKTGTLTQNVMKFKRCTVDGVVFGAPIVKATPGDEAHAPHEFQSLETLLLGGANSTDMKLSGKGVVDEVKTSPLLSFNREMFLRVMSLCHTVVVEKDLDATHGVIAASPGANGKESSSTRSSVRQTLKKFFSSGQKSHSALSSHSGKEENLSDAQQVLQKDEQGANSIDSTRLKGMDGAPIGFAYQAESPDEGALVEASSLEFAFQVIGRDSSGITLAVDAPSIFSDESTVKRLKEGSVTELTLAVETSSLSGVRGADDEDCQGKRLETWEVLAINRFDSTRKRMSILVRSPPELGSIPMLLCKGADSAMVDPQVLRNPSHAMSGDEDAAKIFQRGWEPDDCDDEEWDRTTTLSLQSHLGEFAREGLRTLVLGVRILTEEECSEWLATYNAAATSLKNREEKLTAAAELIETKIHIVGATAIEDKLQDGVAETIAMLGKAGIKLWVLTGDKRETAKEIGYATKVLTEKMRPGITEVVKGSEDEVRTRMAMAFLKLVKHAKLPEYQKSSISAEKPKRLETFVFRFGKFRRRVYRALRRFFHKHIKVIFFSCCFKKDPSDPALAAIDLEEAKEEEILQLTDRRRNVRHRAERIVRGYLNSPEGMTQRQSRARFDTAFEIPIESISMPPVEGPDVFSRANNAEAALHERQLSGLTAAALGALRDETNAPLVDEDILSMYSVLPTDGVEDTKNFDFNKRTVWERAFAVDKDVRHGRLVKHLRKEKIRGIQGSKGMDTSEALQTTEESSIDGPRGLVIEGAALDKLLGDSELEEILFAVANTCDSVIACRVSPAQKAKLVQLVRRYVSPEPVTLAIGDGANDVGMIQAAHAGVGISGKEGAQAVNASDFAIAQFRFLQDLILIHGRWNCMRLIAALLFTFYKHAVLVGCLMVYSRQTLYSGTPFFDQWNIPMFNFVAATPIWSLGAFDRCLDRDYIKKNPEVYAPTRRNELLKNRILIRWVILTCVHIATIYWLSVPSLVAGGAGTSSAFYGMMSNKDPDVPGNGEGGDLKSVGFVAYSSLILLMGFKVLYETRSIIIGEWPFFKCQWKTSDKWYDRAPWTWLAVFVGSFAFYVGFEYVYQIGQAALGPSIFSEFTGVVIHAWQMRALSWMSILLVPIAGMAFDVTGKVFSNLFFPTQTQIHVEIFAAELKETSSRRLKDDDKQSSSAESDPMPNGVGNSATSFENVS